MSNKSVNASDTSSDPLMKGLFPRLVPSIVGLVVFALLWFGIAGRADWIQGWAFLLFFIIYVGVLVVRMSRLDPELVQERNRSSDAAEAWDRIIMGTYTFVLIALLVVTALDGGRFGWSNIPLYVQAIGWVLVCIAGMIIWHVMMVNTYLSSWARLQDERGQAVVKDGLYSCIRHPMYLGIILFFIGLPLALGSWWGIIPSIVIVGLFVYRTMKEDQMLFEGLPGYAEYQKEVRYRLLPGIW